MRACVRACLPACRACVRARLRACIRAPQSFLSTTRSRYVFENALTRERYVRVRTHDTRVNEVTSGVDARKEETKGGNRRRRGGEKERRGHGVRNLFLSGIYHSTTAPVYALLGDASVCVRRID